MTIPRVQPVIFTQGGYKFAHFQSIAGKHNQRGNRKAKL
jgi:hypothetical protein